MVKTRLLVEDRITTQKAVITAFERENFNIVTARMPALLEELLQREIDKLKQAVEHDAPHGDQ